MSRRTGHPALRRGRLGVAAASLTSAAVAAGLARAAYTILSRRPPGGAGTWTRTNHRGEPVTLVEGPALALAAIAAPALDRGLSPRLRAALAVAGSGAAAFGGYDDLAGDGDRRGFRGHLGALAQGEVTTGAVKLGGIGGTGLVAAPLGAALALLGEDLGERAMLGDAGANALGALLGVAAAAGLSRPARVALLAGIAGLTAASEKVSFTAVIERTPALRWLDMLGRRPVPAAPVPGRPAAPLPAGAEEAGHTAAATSP